jgi:hypothetical protein
VRYVKPASGEHPMHAGWQLGSNPYLAHVDPTDPLTDPAYLKTIREGPRATWNADASARRAARACPWLRAILTVWRPAALVFALCACTAPWG